MPIKRTIINIKFNKIALKFSEAVTKDLTIYLYKNNTLITSQVVSTTDNDIAWFDLTGFEITDPNYNYLLIYNTNDLRTAKPISNDVLSNYVSKYIKFLPFIAPNSIDKTNTRLT